MDRRKEDPEFHIMFGEMRGDIKSILAQTIKTNGRINQLEDRADQADIRNARADGGMKVWGTIILAGASIGAFLVNKLIAIIFHV